MSNVDSPAREQQIENLRRSITADLRMADRGDKINYNRAIDSAAQQMVTLRSLFTTPDGRTDWTGRSWDYRQLVSDIYNEAGLDPHPNSNVKAALRYAIGVELRERLSEDELEQAGLKKKSPRDRGALRYREEAGEAEFMEGVFRRMLLTPGMPLDREQHLRAMQNTTKMLNWLLAMEAAPQD